MGKYKKSIIFGAAFLTLCLCTISGYLFFKADNSKVTYTNGKLNIEINRKTTIGIADDSPTQRFWFPQSQKATTTKVLAWLTQAKPYKDQIPQPNYSIKPVYSGNIFPAYFFINWDSQSLFLQPAYYLYKENENFVVKDIKNVVEVRRSNELKSYIESEQLYNWLKNNEWKSEFTSEIPN